MFIRTLDIVIDALRDPMYTAPPYDCHDSTLKDYDGFRSVNIVTCMECGH
jgi:hypothetical protein